MGKMLLDVSNAICCGTAPATGQDVAASDILDRIPSNNDIDSIIIGLMVMVWWLLELGLYS